MNNSSITEHRNTVERFQWGYISTYRTALMGFFCLYIILFHNHFQWTSSFRLLHGFIKIGNVGVDAFLFLSGVGLYYSFQKTGERALPFYKKRVIRLLIPYVVFAVPYYLVLSHYRTESTFFQYVTQIAFVKQGITTTWFIPCILLCYLFYPVVYLLQNKKWVISKKQISRNNITLLLLFLYFIFLVIIRDHQEGLYGNIEIALTRGLIFIVGCHCATWIRDKKSIPSGAVLAAALYIIVFVVFVNNEIDIPVFWSRMSYIPLSIAWIILLSFIFYFLDKRAKIHKFRFMEFVGKHTLELYLSHVMLRNIYNRLFGFPHIEKSGICDYLVVIAVAFIISIPAHFLINKVEKAMLRIKKAEKQNE